MTNGQLAGLFGVLNEWSALKFKDPLVAQRLFRLRRRLQGEMQSFLEAHAALVQQFIDEYGEVKQEGAEPEIDEANPGYRPFLYAQERLFMGGDHEVPERFLLSELVIRERDPQTGVVYEGPVPLSDRDWERLGDVVQIDNGDVSV